MKPLLKLSVLLLVTFCSFGFAQAQSSAKSSANGIAQTQSTANSTPQIQNPFVKIGVEIEIGHKPHPECPGFGFCKVKITVELKPVLESGTAVYAALDYAPSNQSLSWSISRTDLSTRNPSKLRYFDNQTTVTFDTDEVLPQDVASAMGISGVAVIKAGTYPLSYNANLDLFTMSLKVVQTTD
jgi:hypothetical protein